MKNIVANKLTYNEFVLSNVHKDGERVSIIGVVLKYGNSYANCLLVDHNTAGMFKQTYNNIPWVDYPNCNLRG